MFCYCEICVCFSSRCKFYFVIANNLFKEKKYSVRGPIYICAVKCMVNLGHFCRIC